MNKYKVMISREILGFVEVEANNTYEAMEKVRSKNYKSEFIQTGMGYETPFYAQEIKKENG